MANNYEVRDGICEIPMGCTHIDEYEFSKSEGIEKIVIPKSVESIHPCAFLGCNAAVSISEENPHFVVSGGVIFSKDMKKLHIFRINRDMYYVPDGVEEICDNAFFGNPLVNTVVLPDTVTRFGENFGECPRFMFVEYSNRLYDRTEFPLLRQHITKKTDYLVDEHIGTLCSVREDIRDVVIPEGVVDIASGAFNGCTGIESIVLPQSFRVVRMMCFSRMKTLRRVVLPDTLKVIQNYAFGHCGELEEINLPEGLQVICSNAFKDCKKLTRLKLPESLTTIEDGAFEGCDSLEIEAAGNPNFYMESGRLYRRDNNQPVDIFGTGI